MQLRDYQTDLSNQACQILATYKIIYLSIQVRCGKTLIALETCKKFGAKNVLFITKIKAMQSIESDYDNFGYKFGLTIINKESIHKVPAHGYDVVIYDEAHQYGAIPKPGTHQKELRKRFANVPCILMTGTATPENYSQIYHQLQLSNASPFNAYSNFYKWAKDFVLVKQRNVGYAVINDYSDANFEKIQNYTKPITITYTQEQAGFTTNVQEFILTVPMKPLIYDIIKRMRNDKVVTGASGRVIVADTGAKLLQKEHQLISGTIKFEDGTSLIIDNSKALFIANQFKDYKIAIFYKYVAQLQSLKEVIGDKLTTDLDEFNNTNKWIALQYLKFREGVSLKKADYLVMAEIDFSAVTYWQSRDRMTTKDRFENIVYWIFADKGIERKIYKTVMNKKNFTTSHYLKK